MRKSVGCSCSHFKFFRFRTSCHIEGYGVHPDIFWLLRSFYLIDFNIDDLLQESIFICRVIPGCFSFDDLKNMEFDIYDKVYETAKRINADNGKK